MTDPRQNVSQYETEIRQQPEALRRLLSRSRPVAEDLGRRIEEFKPKFVVIAARGSSDNAARYANYLFGVHHGLVTALASPSLITRYQSTLQLDEALAIGVSQSGRSPDIVAMVEHAGQQGALTIALTNDTESPLANVASACLPLEAGDEKAVAATKTYSNQLASFAMLSAAIRNDVRAWAELEAMPEAVTRTIDIMSTAATGAQSFKASPTLAVIGRGFNISTAHEIALKVMELTYAMAQPFPLPDFMHGPIAMLDSNLPAMVIATHGAITADMMEFFSVARERGVKLIVVSDREDVLSQAALPLRVAPDVPEWLSPLVAVVPGQFWALELAISRGLSPDKPRGLSKVTETE